MHQFVCLHSELSIHSSACNQPPRHTHGRTAFGGGVSVLELPARRDRGTAATTEQRVIPRECVCVERSAEGTRCPGLTRYVAMAQQLPSSVSLRLTPPAPRERSQS